MDQRAYGVRPRSISEIFSQTGAIYRDHFETIVGSAAAIMIPAAIIQVLLAAVIVTDDDLLGIFLLQLIAGFIGAAAVAAGLATVTSATAQIIVNGKSSIVEAFDYSFSRIIPTIKATYLLYVIISILMWTFILIPVALFFATAWLVTLQVVVLEGTGARVALGRSWELTRNNRMRVLGSLLLLVVISGVLMILFLLPMFALFLKFFVSGSSGGPPVLAWILAGLFWVIGTVLITPLQHLAWTLIYLDLRARNDGLTTEPAELEAFDAAPAAIPNMD
jgi:hypothetical protein